MPSAKAKAKPSVKSKAKSAPLYHEKQCRQNCTVHSFNNMLQKRVLTPSILTGHILRTTPSAQLRKVLMSGGTSRKPGTNFNTSALSTWIRHAKPGSLPHGSEFLASKSVQVPDDTAELVRIIKEIMVEHHVVYTDGFMVLTKSVNNGFPHAIGVIKRSNRWQIIDSEFDDLQPFKNIRRYLAAQVHKKFLTISFLRGKLTAKELAEQDVILDLSSDSEDDVDLSGGRRRKRTMSKQDLLFRMARLGVYGSVDDLGKMTKQQLVNLSHLE